jgi:hypothetical protein
MTKVAAFAKSEKANREKKTGYGRRAGDSFAFRDIAIMIIEASCRCGKRGIKTNEVPGIELNAGTSCMHISAMFGGQDRSKQRCNYSSSILT